MDTSERRRVGEDLLAATARDAVKLQPGESINVFGPPAVKITRFTAQLQRMARELEGDGSADLAPNISMAIAHLVDAAHFLEREEEPDGQAEAADGSPLGVTGV